MKKLLIVLALVLSACGSPATPQSIEDYAAGQATANPVAPSLIYAKNFVKITDTKMTHDGIGNAIVTGSVRNMSNEYTLVFVELRATVFNGANQIVNTSTSYTDSDRLSPGASSTYKIYVDDPNDYGAKTTVTVEGARFQN